MTIAKVLAVYRVSPLLLVVEAEDGTVTELSLQEIQEGGYHLSAVAWKDLVEEYQLFTCRPTRRETKLAHLQYLNAPSTTPGALSFLALVSSPSPTA